MMLCRTQQLRRPRLDNTWVTGEFAGGMGAGGSSHGCERVIALLASGIPDLKFYSGVI